MEFRERLKMYCTAVETYLDSCFAEETLPQAELLRSMRYSLLAGGKRLRPALVLEFCRICGGDWEKAIPLAAAVEMLHTYSLIHDDLPCMDDDDMRRGKPSNHKIFGYAGAMLAGDALLTRAFGVIASAQSLSAEQKSSAVVVLANAAGDCGMIGGQVIDLDGENKELSFEKLLKLHAYKTGALIRCAATLGCIAAGFAPESDEAKAIATYADKIGLAFQVVDDILDATASEEQLGKTVGSDADNNKTTFLTFYSIEGAAEYAARLTAEAIEAVSGIPGTDVLCGLAEELLCRKN